MNSPSQKPPARSSLIGLKRSIRNENDENVSPNLLSQNMAINQETSYSAIGINKQHTINKNRRDEVIDSSIVTQFQLPIVYIPKKNRHVNLSSLSSNSNQFYEHGQLNEPQQSTLVIESGIEKDTHRSKMKGKEVTQSFIGIRNLIYELDNAQQTHNIPNKLGDKVELDDEMSYHPNLLSGYMNIGPPTRNVESVVLLCGMRNVKTNHVHVKSLHSHSVAGMVRDRFERHETDEFMLVLISYNSSSGRLNHITSSTEVVAFIVSDDTDTGGFRDTVIHSKQEGLKRIYETDPHFMLLQYLLLFHLGNEGYHVKISLRDNKSRDYEEIEDKDLDPDLNQRKSVSLRKYYCYKIMIHTSDGFSLHQAGRLWQQYVVDAVKNYMIHESCVCEKASTKNSKLEAFIANKELPHSHNFTYAGFPTHFSWVAQSGKWKLRQRGDIFGRLAEVHAMSGDLLYLRMLLLRRKGVVSFIELHMMDERKIVLPISGSGIAATLLPGGRTAHSRFYIPLKLDQNSIVGIKHGTYIAELMHQTSLIIWGEAPMQHRHAFEAVDRSLRDIMVGVNLENARKPFGGITIVFGSDFRQILPVIPKGNPPGRNKIISEFRKWQLDVGDGIVEAVQSHSNVEDTEFIVPDNFIVKSSNKNPINTLIDNIYPNFVNNMNSKDYLKARAILTPTNVVVDDINAEILDKIPGNVHTYLSQDSIDDNGGQDNDFDDAFHVEYLNSINMPCLPKHELRIKVGVVVMLMRNLNQIMALCNDTRMIVTGCKKIALNARFFVVLKLIQNI
ncbi:hypothetical protein AgCh_034938 [Apium graveolens]